MKGGNEMTYPNIPNISPLISITTEQTIPLLLSSIALEELALAHIMNAEAEKLQLVLGTLPGATPLSPAEVSLEDLLAVNTSVQRTLRDVIMKEMLLEFKFENILELIEEEVAASCECGTRFSTPANQVTVFNSTEAGPGAGRITNITSQGAIQICGSGSCRPEQTDLFDFVFEPNDATFPDTTFEVTGYTLIGPDRTLGTCCTRDDGRIQFTITGTGLRNDLPANFELVLIEGAGQADAQIILTINGETFTSQVVQGAGQVNVQIFPCNGDPDECPVVEE
jgi:hypothetical protein